jgi:hypothetical protein
MSPRFFKHFFQNPDKTFWLFSFIAVVIIMLSCHIPFFWDNIALSEIASYYFDTSFGHLIPPAGADFGAFTLYAYYLAVVWMIFGKTLLVSHIALIPLVAGIFWEIKNISIRFIRPAYLPLIYVLLLFDPAFGTQMILAGYDIFLLYFILLSVRMLWEKKHLWYSVSLLLLAAVSVRAIVFIFCLMVIHIILLLFIEKNKPRWRDLGVYLPAFIFLIAWFTFHFCETGWWFINPVNIRHRQANDVMMVFRQFGFILWKILDSGRIIVWLFCAFCFCLYSKQILWTTELKKFLMFLAIPLLINILFMILLSNPIGHKYFLQTFVFLSITAVYLIQRINSRKKRIFISLSLLLFLFAGNYIVYPQKYGNAWDTSLKVLPWFGAERQMKAFVEANNIRSSEVYTAFPLAVNNCFAYLQEDFSYSELKADINTYPYVLFSNILNVADLAPYQKVESDWQLLYKVSACQVYIALYKNPGVQKP